VAGVQEQICGNDYSAEASNKWNVLITSGLGVEAGACDLTTQIEISDYNTVVGDPTTNKI